MRVIQLNACRTCRYILSVYWSITTLSTVGYGDWNPTTPFEMAFVVLYMLFVSAQMCYAALPPCFSHSKYALCLRPFHAMQLATVRRGTDCAAPPCSQNVFLNAYVLGTITILIGACPFLARRLKAWLHMAACRKGCQASHLNNGKLNAQSSTIRSWAHIGSALTTAGSTPPSTTCRR